MTLIETIQEYKAIGIEKVVDFEKFNNYTITAHSTQVEGSTLTFDDATLLLDEGLTPKGKPFIHSQMVTDHHKALLFIKEQVSKKRLITPEFIKEINAYVMKSTGSLYNTILGEVDSSKGEYRKGSVYAGQRYFVNYQKVEGLVNKLCKTISDQLKKESITIDDKINLSFYAHFELVSIHPFYDGNGRTSRLLMNYLQALFELPMSVVFKEDKLEYIQSLEKSREESDLNYFYDFMREQYQKLLSNEIKKYKVQNDGEGYKSLDF
ncbi:Fic family protein [Flammeovirga yaeyamensis]|uniref:Fic family protein n=1 Tax=Flammeovirga yaeyamensis TaxID=367791 RepID=A0AAX1N3F9_9BACT|nr:Fic family protein [Flammeovirga yaeyamensis]MBB3696140.1 Fic family protein [Flammeovirga yaeyamensis]NMF34824.1 Fic family protein [Flammeovirga yaeyamensis]QWG00348.1 Fic family protein [Flammeovirga yaeyamensis]